LLSDDHAVSIFFLRILYPFFHGVDSAVLVLVSGCFPFRLSTEANFVGSFWSHLPYCPDLVCSQCPHLFVYPVLWNQGVVLRNALTRNIYKCLRCVNYYQHGDNAKLQVYVNLIFVVLRSICTSNLKIEHEWLRGTLICKKKCFLKIRELQAEVLKYALNYLLQRAYEGWNFNSGNYLFTTGTK